MAGRYRSSVTPYVIAPGEAAVSGLWVHVWAIMASQSGKTALALNVAGHCLHDDPAPVLIIEPTKTLCTGAIHRKVDAMLRNCPALWKRTAKGKAYTTTQKMVGGMSLRTAWAGSAVELAADTARVVIVDEIDRKPTNAEGSVLGQADARHGAYLNGITLGISSPTLGNVAVYIHPITGLEHWQPAEPEQLASESWRNWQGGTRHEAAWPCPHCREYWIPRFKWLKWESDGEPHSTTPARARDTAAVLCPHCGALAADEHRAWMRSRTVFVSPGQRPLAHADDDGCAHVADHTAVGRFEAHRGGEHVHQVRFGGYLPPELRETTDASFWSSGLLHFGGARSFGWFAGEYVRLARQGDDEGLQAFVNTKLSQCFHFGGDAPPVESVDARRAGYALGDVPDGVRALFATVDVQKTRLVYVIRGWGAPVAEGSTLFESWLVDRGELWGDPRQDAVWEDLEVLLEQPVGRHRIAQAAIDSGYLADRVYEFCRRHPKRAVPTKGQAVGDRPFWASTVDVRPDGKRAKYSIQLWHVNAGQMKGWVHARLAGDDAARAAWHLPSDIDTDYCQQLVNEELVVKSSGRTTWVVTGPNHYLDCEALQRFLALRHRTALLAAVGAGAGRRPGRGRRQLSSGVTL